MHIPDGFLDLWICGVFYALSSVMIFISIRQVHGKIGRERSPLLGLVSAGIFAVQMLNWPIPGGTSAHFVGGALAAIVLGPFAGVLSMFSVVLIQALLFGDGGLLTLGANIFNMAIVDVLAGWYVYKLLRKFSKSLAAFLAGWLGIFLAAIAAGIEIGFSSSFGYELGVTLTVMGVWHGILGVIEGAVPK